MSQTLQTVLLSLGTSLIVSIVTFILGLKSGKNQAAAQNCKIYISSYIVILKNSKTLYCMTIPNHGQLTKKSRVICTQQSSSLL